MTKWLNEVLVDRDITITNLVNDLSDGHALGLMLGAYFGQIRC
jgi:hypothetical protein